MIKHLLSIWIWLFGVRFYKSSVIPASASVIRTEFRTVKDKKIEFLFYREMFTDVRYRFGKFDRIKFPTFMITAKVEEGIEGPVMKFNNISYFFRGVWTSWFSDEDLADNLLNVYLNYLNEKL